MNRGLGNSILVMFAAALGPLMGLPIATILTPLSITEIDSFSDLTTLLLIGYLFGLVPSLVSAVLFTVLRSRFGSGYMVAALSGWLGTFSVACGFFSIGNRPSLVLAVFVAIIFGIVPALAVRAFAHRWLRSG